MGSRWWLGNASGRSAIHLRGLYELYMNGPPGIGWAHPYASTEWWNKTFEGQRKPTHDWCIEYPELRSFDYVNVDPGAPRGVNPLFYPLQKLRGLTTSTSLDECLLSRPGLDIANARVCMLGCGSSPLAEQMHDDGWVDITSIDFSEVATMIFSPTCVC